MQDLWNYLAMGGYAAFVWPAYALSALVLAVLLVASLRFLAAAERDAGAAEGGVVPDAPRDAAGRERRP